jgi:AraC family transcriptional activator of pobA
VEILNYNLFGEKGDLPDVVHCETIETRSLLHDWEFAPHRHARLHQVLLLESGNGRTSLEGQEIHLPPLSIVNIPVGVVHGFSFTPGTSGLVVTTSAEIIEMVLQPTEGLHQTLMTPIVLKADPLSIQTMHQIAHTYSRREYARAHILRSLSALLIGQIAHAIFSTEEVHTSPARSNLYTKFEALLEAHFIEHWSVAKYANELNVSTTHLSRICRSATGHSARRLIEDRLILEARRNLVYTSLSVSTIAYQLGFSDPAYFSRVITRSTGLTPSEIRKKTFNHSYN